MARIRTIKPEFWESESVGRLSKGARLLFLASLNFADDEGLLRWNEAYLMSHAFVYDELNIEQITEWMDELVRESMVFPYRGGTTNQRLGWIVNFKSHQVINRPQKSKLPPPSLQNSEVKNMYFKRDQGICHICGELINGDKANISGSKAGSIDHLTPKSKGGSDHPSNIKTAHLSCNKSRVNDSVNDSVNGSVNRSMNGSVGEGKGKERNINTNTNPISKAVPSKKKEYPMTKTSYPIQDKCKSRVSTETDELLKKFKSYDEKFETVKSYLKSLSLSERKIFESGARRLTELGSPFPEEGSDDMNLLLIRWYDKTVEGSN